MLSSFHGWVQWTMSKRPSHGRVTLPQLGIPDKRLVSPLRWNLPFWGPLALLARCAWRKSGSPQDGVARKPPRVKQVAPFQVGRKYRQGPRESSFHFSERTSPVPPQSTSGFPLREENPKTHGAPAGQDSVPQGGSQGRARSAVEKSRITSQVINLSIIIHVGLNNSE